MSPPAGAWGLVVTVLHGLTGLLKKALYVSSLGYAVTSCSLLTQGVALGCAMKPLRGNKQAPDMVLVQQALTRVATGCRPPKRRVRPLRGLGSLGFFMG